MNRGLFAAGVTNAYGKAPGAPTSELIQAMLKSDQCKLIQLTVNDYMAQQLILCEGSRNGLEISSLYNVQIHIVKKATKNTNSTIVTIDSFTFLCNRAR